MRTLRILSVIAIVAMLSTMVIADTPTPPTPWAGVATGQIPVVMDIAPAVSIEVPTGSKIKLMPLDYAKDTPGPPTWTGVANPQPILHSNVRVSLAATLDVVNPVIQTDPTLWGIALQGQPWKVGSGGPLGGPDTFVTTTDSIYLDVAYIGAGRAIPIAVYVQNPNLTARPPESDSRVATVTLMASPY
jgi:hypothetical protein